MLALKLLLIPSFLALVSLAGRRWGPEVAGWLAGFPVVGGSILFVLALEHGAAFAATAATGSLAAVFASVIFSVVYARVCRHHPWTVASPAALGSWALASMAVSLLPAAAPLASVIAFGSLIAAPHLFPRVDSQPLPSRFDRRELVLRMIAGAVLTLVVSALAMALGPARSGILTVFPVVGSVLTIVSQRTSGPGFVITLVQAMARGLWSFSAFCLVLILVMPVLGLAEGFLLATVAAMIVQSGMRRSSAALAPDSPDGK